MIRPKAHQKHLYTPLRYPGGKTSLYDFFADVIRLHDWHNLTYVEPYAGGAGAALALLIRGNVEKIVINDYDDAIYSFWYSILNNTDAFVELIKKTPITVSEWQNQKAIYKKADITDRLSLGFSAFYLNRTNRSGILNAGPIGGKDQSGDWKLDARYNKEKMIQKIRLISSYKDSIKVINKDGVEVIREFAPLANTMMYIDPPYFVKGANLYLNAFRIKDHENLANELGAFSNSKWFLSYDNEPEILNLYSKFSHEIFSLRYSAHHNTRLGSELMVFSDAIDKEIIDSL